MKLSLIFTILTHLIQVDYQAKKSYKVVVILKYRKRYLIIMYYVYSEFC